MQHKLVKQADEQAGNSNTLGVLAAALGLERLRHVPDAVRRYAAERKDAVTPWVKNLDASKLNPYDVVLHTGRKEINGGKSRYARLFRLMAGTRDSHAYMLFPDAKGVLKPVVLGGQGEMMNPAYKRLIALKRSKPKKMDFASIRKAPGKYKKWMSRLNTIATPHVPMAKALKDIAPFDMQYEPGGFHRIMRLKNPLTPAEAAKVTRRAESLMGGSFTGEDVRASAINNMFFGKGKARPGQAVSTCSGGICSVLEGLRPVGDARKSVPHDFRFNPHFKEVANLSNLPGQIKKPISKLNLRAAKINLGVKGFAAAAPLGLAAASFMGGETKAPETGFLSKLKSKYG